MIYTQWPKTEISCISENKDRLRLCCTVIVSYDRFLPFSITTRVQELAIVLPYLKPIAIVLRPCECVPQTETGVPCLNRFTIWRWSRIYILDGISEATFGILRMFWQNESMIVIMKMSTIRCSVYGEQHNPNNSHSVYCLMMRTRVQRLQSS